MGWRLDLYRGALQFVDGALPSGTHKIYVLVEGTTCQVKNYLDNLTEDGHTDIVDWVNARAGNYQRNPSNFREGAGRIAIKRRPKWINFWHKLSRKAKGKDIRVLCVEMTVHGEMALILISVGENHSRGDKKSGKGAPADRLYDDFYNTISSDSFEALAMLVNPKSKE